MKIQVQLPKKWVDYLVHQPESGMGYQRVDVILDDGTRLEDCVVFNAEEIEMVEPHAKKTIVEMRIHEKHGHV